MYLYMIKIEGKARKCFYTGITNDIERRYKEHLMGIGSKWAKRYFRGANKKLVYVEKVKVGFDWYKRERQVKQMAPRYKEKLICSESNILDNVLVSCGIYDCKVRIKLK